MRHLLVAAALATSVAAPASAVSVTFIPPSDMTGAVLTTNENDGYSDGRGAVFIPDSNFLLESVGIFQDLIGITLNYSVEIAIAPTEFVGPGTVLRSGSALVTTDGLEFIDFAFSPLTLMAGTAYNVVFSFEGEANQNFFYDQRGAEPYAQSGFSGIDGFLDYVTSNFVIPAIRLNGTDIAVPAPQPLALMLFGLAAAALARRVR